MLVLVVLNLNVGGVGVILIVGVDVVVGGGGCWNNGGGVVNGIIVCWLFVFVNGLLVNGLVVVVFLDLIIVFVILRYR